MGRVFTFEQITKGYIPTPDGFQQVLGFMKNRLQDSSAVVGAMLYGSAATGTLTKRSDIDCLVITDAVPFCQQRFRHLQRDIQTVARRHYVPLQLEVIDIDIAATPVHSISFSFRHYLEYIGHTHGYIKENPLDFLSSHGDRNQIKSYLAYKLRAANKGLYEFEPSESRMCKSIGRALGNPLHVARKIVSFFDKRPQQHTKEEVISLYAEVAEEKLATDLIFLLEADTDYSRVLDSQMHTPDQSKYTQYLKLLRATELASYEFIRDNALLIATLD